LITPLLAHIAIPLIAGLVLVIFVRAASNQPVSWNDCYEVALDFVLISIGATGATFLNPKLSARWGERTPIYSILVVLLSMLLAAVLIYRHHHRSGDAGPLGGSFDLFLGVLSLMVVSMMFYFAT
jgi:hypothetical protein